MQIAYNMDNSMNEWFAYMSEPTTHEEAMEKFSKEYKIDELFLDAQIDWAIDNPTDWHYTKYWDGETYVDDEGRTVFPGFGYDKDMVLRTSSWDHIGGGVDGTQNISTEWILRGGIITDNQEDSEWFYGSDQVLGVKSQLKDDQYTLEVTDAEANERMIKIDWTQHTLYCRVRWAVTCDWIADNGEITRLPVFSEWSETASYGKGVEAFKPYSAESLAAPVIKDLRYYEEEFNGYPQIACKLEVPEELSRNLTAIQANGGFITVYWEGRIPGGEWVELQGDFTVTSGEAVIALQNLATSIIEKNKENGVSTAEVVVKKDSPVELRCRYFCSQYASLNGEFLGEFYSPYSEVLTFGTQEMSHTEEPVVEESKQADESKVESSTVQKTEEPKCKVCKNCPAPLGLCIWIWIAIIAAVIIIVVIIVIVVVKNKKKDTKEQK